MMDREGNDVPFEVVSEDPVHCWDKKHGSYGYVALHLRRASHDAVEYPLTPDDPRLKFFGRKEDGRKERQSMGEDA